MIPSKRANFVGAGSSLFRAAVARKDVAVLKTLDSVRHAALVNRTQRKLSAAM